MKPGHGRLAGAVLAAVLAIAVLPAAAAGAPVVRPPFDAAYSVQDLGSAPGVPSGNYAGLVLKPGSSDRLLLSRGHQLSTGALYEIGLARDAEGRITGFEGTATRYADAAEISGGLDAGPGDVLFLSRQNSNSLGQTKPGSAITDRIIDLEPLGLPFAVTGVRFVPPGFPGAGSLKLSGATNRFYDATVAPDGGGTYDVQGLEEVGGQLLSPREATSFDYVAAGSPLFDQPAMLVSQQSAGFVAAYDLDSDGNPLPATLRSVVEGVGGVVGGYTDRVSNDYLFTAGEHVYVLHGFAAPTATLTVVTQVVNDGGGALTASDFSVHVKSGETDVNGSPQPGDGTGTSYTLPANSTYTVTEAPPGPYERSFSGDCDATGSVTLAPGDSKTCVITNDDVEPTLTVIKRVVNDHGGDASAGDWMMHIRTGDPLQDVNLKSPFPGQANPGTQRTLVAGTYVVGESGGPEGYAATISGDCAADGTVTLSLAQNATCTITNDDVGPSMLKVVKHVVNDDGGTLGAGDFSLHVLNFGGDVPDSPQAGSEAGTTYVLAGDRDYQVAEDGVAGYVRTISGDCTPDGRILLLPNQVRTCTITNDDVPPLPPAGCLTYADFSPPTGLQLLGDAAVAGDALRLTTNLGNQAGYAWYGAPVPVADGFTTDFRFRFTDQVGIGDLDGPGADGITFAIQNAGVVATGAVGGALGYQGLDDSVVVELDSFDNGTGLGDPNGNHVAVHTRGTEPNGPGAEGDSLVGAAALTPFLQDGQVHHARVVYAGGELSIYVDDLAAPALTVQIDIADRLALPGHRAFVGFTAATGAGAENHDVLDWSYCPGEATTARLSVVKQVVNDDGGTRSPGDFVLHVKQGGEDVAGSPQPGSAEGLTRTLEPGAYTVSEDAAPGYAASFSGACDAEGAVTLAAGDEKTCVVTNDDLPPADPPTLTLIKHVVNDDGGSIGAGDFSLHVRSSGVDVAGSPAPGSETGTTYTLEPGTYDVSEVATPGYASSFSGACDANGTVTLQPGESKTCTLTNDDIAPTLTVLKQVVNDDGGGAVASDWTMHIGSGVPPEDVAGKSPFEGAGSPGVTRTLAAGTYVVSESGGPAGYAASISGDCALDGSIMLAVGESKTCTITNDDVAPTLRVVKQVVNDDFGTRTPEEFSLHVKRSGADVGGSPQPGSVGGTQYTLTAGAFTVSEDPVSGYAAGFTGDCDDSGQVALAPGDNKTCTVTNDDSRLDALPDWVWRRGKELSFPINVNEPPDMTHTCAWSFGDGATSDECTFRHTYDEIGNYEAMLRVDFSDGETATDTIAIRVIAEDPAGGGGGNSGRGEVVVSSDRIYTLDDDFDSGKLLNVNHEAPQHDELRLNSRATPFPFVYIANSARGTAVRIDAVTGTILGEYLTAPEGRHRNPSRTTVDKLGNAWVTNRDEADALEIDGVPTPMGSVARMGLLIGGSRTDANGAPDTDGGYVKPPFEYSTCIDRDHDGLIRTSSGLGDILEWSNAMGADHDGGVETAVDECLINYTRVLGVNARTVAIDSNNDAWIGGANSVHEKVDGDTGERVPGTALNLGCGGYGGLIDAKDVLWSARYGNGLLRYDTKSATGDCIGFGVGDYGLGIDPATGHIWHSYLSGNTVVKINPDGTEAGRFSHGNGEAQGVAVDASGNVWVAHSLFGATTIGHLRTDGTYVGNVDLRGGNGPTGVAVDGNGRVWSANLNSNSASRVDPEIGPIRGGGLPVGYTDLTVDLGAGAGPYNYSDMTGLVSLGAASPSGFWSVVQDGGAAGREWGSIAWNGQTPESTSIEVEARAADTQAGLGGAPFVGVGNGTPLDLRGRFIEVRVTLKTSQQGVTPVLQDVRITARPAAAPTLRVVKQVVNDDGDSAAAGDFSLHVKSGGADVAGSPQPGSEGGTQYTLTAGSYTVSEDAVAGYAVRFSGDCDANGTVTLAAGEAKTCTVTNDDVAPTLTVVKHVVNDDGGSASASDWTMHIRAGDPPVDVTGKSPFTGAEDPGTERALAPGTYRVGESGGPEGYLGRFSGDCAADGTITLAAGESKTCTLTNDDIPAGQRVNLESYSVGRTDGDWGLVEPFLSDTLGYVQDPANFGPAGVVHRHFDVGNGIDVASAETLEGVDVFFTGWVTTASYSAEEKEALRAFVRGGGTLIATTDDTEHTLADVFGLVQGDGSATPQSNVITEPDHPIPNGPFGVVAEYNQYFATGHYSSLGPNAHEIGRYADREGTTLAVIERGALGLGSGAVIFVPDVDVFSNHLSPGGGSIFNANLIKNIFAFAVEEPARPALAIGDISKDEGDAGTTTFELPVTLSSPSAAPVDVHWATAGETAAAPEDFTAASGDLHFEPGDTVESVTVAVTGDTVIEPDEDFVVNLSAASGARLIRPQGRATIANDDAAATAPTLTVVKQVVNDAGGELAAGDFSVHVRAGADDVAGSPQPGSATGTTYTLVTGETYTVSEDPVAAYEGTVTGDCDADGSITLQAGDEKTCTITNRDVAPALRVVKHVVNDHGGTATASDFVLHVKREEEDVAGSPRPGDEAGSVYTLTAGEAYKVSETGVDGYTGEFSGDCDAHGEITLALGESATCTLTNDDVAPVTDNCLGTQSGRVFVTGHDPDFHGHEGAPQSNEDGARHILQRAITYTTRAAASPKLLLVTGTEDQGPEYIDPRLTLAEAGYAFDVAHAADADDAARDLRTVDFSAYDGIVVASDFGGWLTQDEVDVLNERAAAIEAFVTAGGGLVALAESQSSDDFGFLPFIVSALPTGEVESGLAVTQFGEEIGLTDEDVNGSVYHNWFASGGLLRAVDVDTRGTPDEDDDRVVSLAGELCSTLTVVKQAVNDDGGTAAAAQFAMHVRSGGVDVAGSPFAGSAAGTTRTLTPGSYAVSESGGPAGYARSFSGDCDAGGAVTLKAGESKTCTVRNDDIAPTLRVVKQVVNDDGGTASAGDFTMHLRSGGADVTGSPFAGSAAGSTTKLKAGSYTVSESGGPAGYAASFSGGCGSAGEVTLALGDTKTCTVMNDDPERPTLRVVTRVVNDDGGTRAASFFSVAVRSGGVDVAGSPQPGDAAGTSYEPAPGDYVVAGAGGAGAYSASISGACTPAGAVTLAVGDAKTCTVTFDDVAPTLTIVKQVVNDDGGAASAGDFTMHVRSGGADVTGSPFAASAAGTSRTLKAGSYTVSESGGPAGYAASFSGGCGSAGGVTLALGETKTCTVRNDDIAPTLRVVKQVVNDHGGSRGAGDWTMHIRGSGTDVAFSGDPGGTTTTLKAGGYSVSETGPGGYAAAVAGDCTGDGAVTLAVGDAKTCTVTNDDDAPPPPPPPMADLVVSKTASDTTPFLGDTVRYTLTVSNAGPNTAIGSVLTDDVDGRLAPGTTPPGCTAAGLPGGATRVRCALGDIGAGQSRSVALEVRPRMACSFAGTSRDDADRAIGASDGDDVICGAAGADTFSGGRGDDTLFGLAPLEGLPGTVPNSASASSVTADQNTADNTNGVSLTVAAGRDRGDDIDGGNGRDRLIGAAGTDDLNGGAGADAVEGGAGDDALNGGGGNDELDGGRGRDIVKGGAGADTVDADDGTRDTVDCGGGSGDRATVDRRDRVDDCETVRRR